MPQPTPIDDLAQEIEKAFAPNDFIFTGPVSVETYDDDRAEEFFRGTRWDEHRRETSDLLCSTMSFMTPEAFCYFVPAFLLASTRSEDFSEECWGHLVAKFDLALGECDLWSAKRAEEILAILTREQKDAIRHFLEYDPKDHWSEDEETLHAIELLKR